MAEEEGGVKEVIENIGNWTDSSYIGNEVGTSMMSDTTLPLLSEFKENMAQFDTKSLGSCALTAVIAEGEEDKCDSDQWAGAVVLEGLSRIYNKISENVLPPGASQAVDFTSAALEARVDHISMIKMFDNNDVPGFISTEVTIDGTKFNAHVDASCISEADQELCEPTVYLDADFIDTTNIDINGTEFAVMEQKLAAQGAEEVYKYDQDNGGGYRDMLSFLPMNNMVKEVVVEQEAAAAAKLSEINNIEELSQSDPLAYTVSQ